MSAPVSFESATEKQKLREIRKKERNRILKEVSNIVSFEKRVALLCFVSLQCSVAIHWATSLFDLTQV